MKERYDVIIVGAGLFGCVCADLLKKKGLSILVVEKMNHIGGTCYTERKYGIDVHKYGAHIFRTNNEAVFNYIKQFSDFNNFVNSPIAIYHNQAYNLPFNMNTFSKVWNICRPEEAKAIIEKEKECFDLNPIDNLEKQAIYLAGKTIYEMFIKEYTEKQWGRKCSELPPSIIRRIPFRFTYDNNYYDAKYQGIPISGYTEIFNKMLSGCDVTLNTDFNKNKDYYFNLSNLIIYTGPIDEFFNFQFGELEYRGLKFVEQEFDMENYQGNAVLNYCDHSVKYTRSIEHKHFTKTISERTIVSFEYPSDWSKGEYPFYPVNDKKNDELYSRYKEISNNYKNVVFGGRLGNYKYFDMQDTIIAAMDLCSKIDL